MLQFHKKVQWQANENNIFAVKSENWLFVHSRKIPRDITTFVQRKLRAVSHQTYTFYHFFKWRYCQEECRKKGLFCCWHLFCSRYDAQDGDFDHLILEQSFLSSFSFCVVDSWLSFSHDRRSPSTEVSLSLTVFVGRNQDFEREESCSKFKTANKRLLEHLYLKTLFWHHE